MRTNKEKSFNRFPPLQEGQGKAFTLVELIVVITILAILGTIAFLSLQGYSKNARDGVRTSDMKNIEKGLGIMLVKSGIIPTPDDTKINIMSSGTIIGIQGYAGKLVQAQLGLSKDSGKDPSDGTYYTYLTNSTKTSYQLLGFLEGTIGTNNLTKESYAVDYTNRNFITYGKEMGILLGNSGTTLNQPLQELTSGNLELLTGSTVYKAVLNSTDTIVGTGNILQNLQFSYKSGNGFNAPTTCPTGFIQVPGNKEFNQPGFCVAQYEMSYSDGDTPTSTVGGVDWNTLAYVSGKVPTSIAGKYPIADITQQQAIDSCKIMGNGYHLITNNEWMTVARDIEQQGVNWSGGIVGISNIYNGVSNSTMGCLGQTNSIYTALTRNWATKTGGGFGNANCDTKRQLKLSNGQTIWDLSGNVWEHVNGANTINGVNYNTMQAQACGRTDTVWNWNSFYGNDGTPACNFSNGYTYGNIGPKTPNLNASNGIGRIYDYGGSLTDRVFLRGASAGNGGSTGFLAVNLGWGFTTTERGGGFRCAF